MRFQQAFDFAAQILIPAARFVEIGRSRSRASFFQRGDEDRFCGVWLVHENVP
jgi:hypothetical protein